MSYCMSCGASLVENQRYCSACGKPVVTGPPAYTANVPAYAPGAPGVARGRVAGHIQVLGTLWLIESILRLIPGLGILTFTRWGMHFMPPHFPVFVLPFINVLGGLLTATAVFGLFTGWGLLSHQPWARMAAIILAILNLIHFPLGTALGIYTLWVLMPAECEAEYRNMNRPV
jgi:hypothetical protein